VAFGDGLCQHFLGELLLGAQTVQYFLLHCSHGSYIIINI
jgi:hypothetical protein